MPSSKQNPEVRNRIHQKLVSYHFHTGEHISSDICEQDRRYVASMHCLLEGGEIRALCGATHPCMKRLHFCSAL